MLKSLSYALTPSFANTHLRTLSVSHTRTFSYTLCLTHTHIFTHSLLAGGTWTIFIHNTLRENMSIMKKRAGTSPFFSTNTFVRNLTSSFPTVFKNETSFFLLHSNHRSRKAKNVSIISTRLSQSFFWMGCCGIDDENE